MARKRLKQRLNELQSHGHATMSEAQQVLELAKAALEDLDELADNPKELGRYLFEVSEGYAEAAQERVQEDKSTGLFGSILKLFGK